MANVMDAMPHGVDPRAMSGMDFTRFLLLAAANFRVHVLTHPDYQFARNGGTMPLGDWFEQFGCHAGVM